MDVSARHIHEKQFHDAWRGYNQEEVDDFLDRVAEVLDRSQQENADLRERLRQLEQAVATSREAEEMLKKTLVTAQQAAEEAIAKAKAKADHLVGEAEERARRASEEARERTSSAEAEIRRKALEAETDMRRRSAEADRDHVNRKRDLDQSIERLRAFETELKQRLRTILEQQLRTLDQLTGRAATPPQPTGAQARPVATRPGHQEARPTARPDPADRHPIEREPQSAGRPTASPAQQPERAVTERSDRPAAHSGEEQPEPEPVAPQRRGVRGLFWRDDG